MHWKEHIYHGQVGFIHNGQVGYCKLVNVIYHIICKLINILHKQKE